MNTNEQQAVEGDKGWIQRHPRLILLAANLLFLVLLELALRAIASHGLIRTVNYSTTTPSEFFLADSDRDFGVWHNPHRSVTHSTPCFNVEYSSNSYGARDKERSHRSSSERVFVLGDSFVEGFGVNSADRFTDIAEKRSGVEFLNFGVSGNFGSIQQWLLYKKFAPQFDHTATAIFFVPANDFEDNDLKYFPKTRYRPYLVEDSSGNFKVEYPIQFENREQPKAVSTGRFIRRTLYNNIVLLNLFKQVGQKIEQSDFKSEIKELSKRGQEVPYDSFSALDLRRLLFTYEKIIELANGKKVVLFIIPTKTDLESYKPGRQQYEIVTALQEFAKQFKNFEVVDLMPEFRRYAELNGTDYDEFTQTCDPHWSPLGNRIAGELLAKVALKLPGTS